ncbi:Gfo/Idh/MocA family protein [Solwaraspora sp. WMMB335]|uniref:Gfo/Idh/MocA family protein n=1 Tax=Solwaraspora sp. WMMB335 TaxID=3404118 RepID=UPI003B94B244
MVAPKIGIVGVGGVARYAHLPAYRRLGLDVHALFDVDEPVAREVARQFQVPVVAGSLEELAGRVDVVDLATPPAGRIELLRRLAALGTPVLVQKPLCTTWAELAEAAALRSTGMRLRLNLTGRHVSAWRKVAELLVAGAIGRPHLCTIVNRDWWDRAPGRWDHSLPGYIVYEMLIHHLDLLRFWFGPPQRIAARGGTHPGQLLRQANWVSALIEYGSGPLAQVLEDWTMPEYGFAHGHPFEEVLISGSAGVLRAGSERVELSPVGGNQVRVWHLPRPGQTLPGEQLAVNWFPDSFGAAMNDFLATRDDPVVSASDWAQALALTADTIVAAESLGASRWLDFPPEDPVVPGVRTGRATAFADGGTSMVRGSNR